MIEVCTLTFGAFLLNAGCTKLFLFTDVVNKGEKSQKKQIINYNFNDFLCITLNILLEFINDH